MNNAACAELQKQETGLKKHLGSIKMRPQLIQNGNLRRNTESIYLWNLTFLDLSDRFSFWLDVKVDDYSLEITSIRCDSNSYQSILQVSQSGFIFLSPLFPFTESEALMPPGQVMLTAGLLRQYPILSSL